MFIITISFSVYNMNYNIIIIQYLYSALKSYEGYRGAGGFRLRLSQQVSFEAFLKSVHNVRSSLTLDGVLEGNLRCSSSSGRRGSHSRPRALFCCATTIRWKTPSVRHGTAVHR